MGPVSRSRRTPVRSKCAQESGGTTGANVAGNWAITAITTITAITEVPGAAAASASTTVACAVRQGVTPGAAGATSPDKHASPTACATVAAAPRYEDRTSTRTCDSPEAD